MESQYYLAIGGQQSGPYYLDELRKVGLKHDALIWCEGQSDWLPAWKVPALAGLWAMSGALEAPRGPRRPAAFLDRPYRIASLLYPFVIGAFLLSIAFMAFGLLVAHTDRAAPGQDRMLYFLTILRLVFSAVGSFLLTGFLIAFLVLLYRVTVLIQDGGTRVSPGKAVGFLFIPIVQTIWIFVAFYGTARALNRYADRHQLLAPRASVLLGLAIPIYFVLTPVPYLGGALAFTNLLLLPMFMGSIYRTASCFCDGNERFSDDDEPYFGPMATRAAWRAGLTAMFLPLISTLFGVAGFFGVQATLADTDQQRAALEKKWEEANEPIRALIMGRPINNVMPPIPLHMEARVRQVEQEQAALETHRLMVIGGFAGLIVLGLLALVAAIPLATLARRSNAAFFTTPSRLEALPVNADAPSLPPGFW